MYVICLVISTLVLGCVKQNSILCSIGLHISCIIQKCKFKNITVVCTLFFCISLSNKKVWRCKKEFVVFIPL